MQSANLVGILPGIKHEGLFDTWEGLATALWPTDALCAIAATHGVTTATRKEDWCSDPTEVTAVSVGLKADLLIHRTPMKGVSLPELTPAQSGRMANLARDLEAINAVNSSACFRGAAIDATLTRRFRHSWDFGGRCYGGAYQQLSEPERGRITIDWERSVEVDVKASQLTVLLGLTGARHVPEDPYEFPGLPRAVVKAWIIQTLGTGRPAGKWSDRNAGAKSGYPVKAVRAAVVERYPFLNDLVALVPAAALETVPLSKRGWAAGQWIAMREAEIIMTAMVSLAQDGIAVLPVHDSLIVRASAEQQARDALTAAFQASVAITPRVTVTMGLGAVDTEAFWDSSKPKEQAPRTVAA